MSYFAGLVKTLIRDYIQQDFNQVMKLWQACDLATPGRGDDHKVIMRTIDAGGRLRIMENEERHIIGTSWLSIDGRRTYLHHFGIHPDFQGLGLSKQLLDDSMACAREMGLQIKLEVHRNNSIARHIYVKEGFKYLGDYDVFIIRDIKQQT